MNDLNLVSDYAFISPITPISAAQPLVPTWDNELQATGLFATDQSGLPLNFVRGAPVLSDPHLDRGASLRMKRVIDLVFSSSGLILLLPLFIFVAVAIKFTSKGPIFFRQQRSGLNGSLFLCLKFRSMRMNEQDPTGLSQAVRNDPRLTVVGRFLRRTSIDELPQLINVLRGEMSLVGPRPHVPGMSAGGMPYRDLVPYYDLRLSMSPGMTGWAQVKGWRGRTDTIQAGRARVDHDVAYIANFSVWLDLKIIVATIWRELAGGTGN